MAKKQRKQKAKFKFFFDLLKHPFFAGFTLVSIFSAMGWLWVEWSKIQELRPKLKVEPVACTYPFCISMQNLGENVASTVKFRYLILGECNGEISEFASDLVDVGELIKGTRLTYQSNTDINASHFECLSGIRALILRFQYENFSLLSTPLRILGQHKEAFEFVLKVVDQRIGNNVIKIRGELSLPIDWRDTDFLKSKMIRDYLNKHPKRDDWDHR